MPPGFTDQSDTRWPTLYLLDGSGDEYVVWARNTDVEQLTADSDLLVALTAAGGGGAYSDWWQDGEGGQPAWETFGIPATVHAYGDGTHVWPYWERELHASYPMLLDALGVPAP